MSSSVQCTRYSNILILFETFGGKFTLPWENKWNYRGKVEIRLIIKTLAFIAQHNITF